MKRILLILFTLLPTMATWADVRINEKNFPDKNFREWLLEETAYGADGVLTNIELDSVTQMDVSDYSIKSLQGIAFFKALKVLKCLRNQLSTLDVSKNKSLEVLDCFCNQLTKLDISKNKALKYLFCDENKLTTLDTSKNKALIYIACFHNHIYGAGMDALVKNLRTVSQGCIDVVYIKEKQNQMTVKQVTAARAKGWTIRFHDGSDYDGTLWHDYAGS